MEQTKPVEIEYERKEANTEQNKQTNGKKADLQKKLFDLMLSSFIWLNLFFEVGYGLYIYILI